MSLARIAVRIAAVKALQGQTPVGPNVLDSQIAALDVAADGTLKTDQQKPFIAVYTGAASAERDLNVRALNQNGLAEIEFEMGISVPMLALNPETGETEVFEGVPGTDANFELYLDLVTRDVSDALVDPENEWAEIFRGLIYRVVKTEQARTASGHIGTRLAGRQLKLTVELVEDPIRGEELCEGSPFARLLAKLEQGEDPTELKLAAEIRTRIEGTHEAWAELQRRMGLTAVEMQALGLAPLATNEDGSVPEFGGAVIDPPHAAEISVEAEE